MTPPATRKTTTTTTTVPLPEAGGDTPDTVVAPDEHPMMTTRAMRQMHALLRNHGITGDAAVLDYLTAATGRDITSRKDLTPTEGAHVIAELEAEPVTPAASPAALAQLRAPFPDEAIGKLPKSTCRDCSKSDRKVCPQHRWVSRCQVCGNSHTSASIHLDYVGHADVTARLLEVDPEWTWRPFTAEEIQGIAPGFRDGLWIMLTICGVTRPGFGDASGKTGGNAVKEAIGDALRNAGMRFGVALDLWAKGDREWAHAPKEDPDLDADNDSDYGGDYRPAPPRQDPPQVAALGPDDWASDPTQQAMTATLIEDLERLAAETGTDLAGITEKWRTRHGGLPVERLHGLNPMTLAPLVDQITDYLRQMKG